MMAGSSHYMRERETENTKGEKGNKLEVHSKGKRGLRAGISGNQQVRHGANYLVDSDPGRKQQKAVSYCLR